MASVIEVLTEGFEAIRQEAKERELRNEPFCAADFNDRFVRLSEEIKRRVGLNYETTLLIILYKQYEGQKGAPSCSAQS